MSADHKGNVTTGKCSVIISSSGNHCRLSRCGWFIHPSGDTNRRVDGRNGFKVAIPTKTRATVLEYIQKMPTSHLLHKHTTIFLPILFFGLGRAVGQVVGSTMQHIVSGI